MLQQLPVSDVGQTDVHGQCEKGKNHKREEHFKHIHTVKQ